MKILFLCTGNSCRSQMAEGWGKKLLAGKAEVFSAGTNPGTVDPRAIKVMAEAGVDISGHRSRVCRREDVMNADLIIAMAQEHCDFLAGLVPGVKAKIKVLNIKDPIGQGIPVYEEVVKSLEDQLKKLWNEIVE